MHRNLSELIVLARHSKIIPHNEAGNRFVPASNYELKVPDSLDIIEAATENASSYRKSTKLMVTDGRNLVFMAPNEQHYFTEFSNRILNISDIEDKKVIRRLLEKALDINIRKLTCKGMLQGIYLLEQPLKLYRCGRANLYLGFSLNVRIKSKGDSIVANVETTLQAYVRESILDYIRK